MRILFVSSIIPYPPVRGDKLRIYNIIKQFNRYHELKIISFVKNEEEKRNAKNFKKAGYNLTTVNLPRITGIFNLFRMVINKDPLQVSFHYSKKMASIIQQETRQNNYDIVYFHLFTVAQYCRSVKNPYSIKVFDMTDATALYLQRYLEIIRNPIKKFFVKFELARIRLYEHIIKIFDVTYVCSMVDLNYLRTRIPLINIRHFTNGVDTDYFQVEKQTYKKHRIIFVGSLPYYPNTDAVLFFAKEVFPKIKISFPDAEFYIIGSNPPEEVKSLASESIFVTGFVEDIKKEYLVSEVNVAPIRFGAGIQNKIIESLSLGIPTVSSKLAVESFDEEIKKFIFTAETADEYANMVSKIFNNSSIRDSMMIECIRLIKEKMTWEKLVNTENIYLESLVEERKKTKLNNKID
ncbi:MAG: glycosyltransferase [Ignavibacteria bacterium]|nr:glycosyltransferase [Ignavibacteria bacterium]